MSIFRKIFIFFFSGTLFYTTSVEALPTFSFDKTFYSRGVDEKAKIVAGGIAETWIDPDFTTTKQAMDKGINWVYAHASTREQAPQKVINKGLPISNTGKTAAQGFQGSANASGIAGTADIKINVSAQQPAGKIVKARLDKDKIFREHKFNQFVQTTIKGNGKLNDVDRDRSADAGAAVKLKATNTFLYTNIKKQPKIQSVSKVKGKLLMHATGSTADLLSKDKKGNVKDPFYVEITDLDTGNSVTEAIATYDLSANNADIIISDTSINITIDRTDLSSFASFNFSSELSSWIVNPFSYGVSFDNTGLSLFGNLGLLTDWNIVTTDKSMSASYLFEDDLMPFDYMEILPPDHLFIEGHTYEYSQGSTIGASILASVSTPGSHAIFSIGILGLIAFRKKTRSE